MRVVRFLLFLVALSSARKSTQPEKWRQKLQALLFNYRHSASEPRTKTRQGATINCDNSENANKQCLLEPDKYFANMVFTLSYRTGTLDNFEKRYKRLTKFINVIRGKASKNATFESVTSMLLDSLGGNATNFTCLGEEERQVSTANVSKGISIPEYDQLRQVSRLYQRNDSKILDAISQGSLIYDVLSNCSSSVSYWCTVDNVTVANMNSTWKTCEKLRKEIVQKSDRCRLSKEDAKCFCYEGLDLLVQAFKREKCVDIKEDERKTVDEKAVCLNAFKACRQMENEAFFTINQCDHKPVDLLIENTRSLQDFLDDEDDYDDYAGVDYEEDYHDDSWYDDYEHYPEEDNHDEPLVTLMANIDSTA